MASLLIAVVGIFIYHNGLSGGIPLLDDQHVLSRLIESSGDNWFEGFVNYAAGDVGILKRPISYLTFYLQKESLSDGLLDFKLVNVALHLANGCLVYALIFRLFRSYYPANTVSWLALFGGLFWLSSTIHVSSVLYVTQRMTLLAAFFALLAFHSWFNAKSSKSAFQKTFWLFLTSFFVGVGTLSKENAILVCAILLLFENTFYKSSVEGVVYKLWKLASVYAPLLLLTAHILLNSRYYFVSAFRARDFTSLERTLTQPGILLDYLSKLFVPFGEQFGVIHSYSPIARGLIDPPETLINITLLLSIAVIAWLIRKKYALISMGVFFFFIAHSMESTFLSLELYFEHRNYLPSVGIAIALSAFMGELTFLLSRKIKQFLVVAGAAYIFMLSLATFLEAGLWSKPITQAMRWYSNNTSSQRAHSHMGGTLLDFGYYDEAAKFYSETYSDFPGDVSKDLLWLEILCYRNVKEKPLIENIVLKVKGAKFQNESLVILNSLYKAVESARCEGVNSEQVLKIADEFILNENYSSAKIDLLVLTSKMLEYQGDYEQALNRLEQAALIKWRLDVMLALSQRLYLSGRYSRFASLHSDIQSWCSESTLRCVKYRAELKYLESLVTNLERE